MEDMGAFQKHVQDHNLGAPKSSLVKQLHTFQCMGLIFYMENKRVPLKFHVKYLTHTLKGVMLYNIENLSVLRALM